MKIDGLKPCKSNGDGPHNFQMTPYDGMLFMHCTQCGKTAALMQETNRLTKQVLGVYWQIMDFSLPGDTANEPE